MNIAQQFINIMGAKGVGGIVEPPVATGTFNLLDSPVGTLYNYQTSSLFTGGTPASYEWAGTPPTWAALDPLTGEIVGVSTEGTWAGYAVVALNLAGSATTNTDTITVSVFGNYGAAVDAGQVDDGATYAGEVYYVDATGGDDANDGLTPATAWQTMIKANTKLQVGYWDTVPPNNNTIPAQHEPWTAAPSGSAILFKRGETFAGSLYVHGWSASGYSENITIGAYGTGARPTININDDEGGRYRGSGIGTNKNEVHIKNLNIQGDGVLVGNGIGCSEAINSTITNTVVGNNWLDGIYAEHADGLVVDGCTIVDNQLAGGNGGGLAGGGDGFSILNSTFRDNGRNQIHAHNIYARHLTNASFSGNLLEGGSNMGLVVHGACYNVDIIGNLMTGNSNGLNIAGGYAEVEVFDNFNVSRNIIRDNGLRAGEQGYGMILSSMTNSIVANNLAYGNKSSTMVFSANVTGNTPSANTLISSNTLIETVTGYGFTLNGAGMSGIVLQNNILSSPSSNTLFTKASDVNEADYTLDNNLYFAPNAPNGKPFKFNNVDYDLAGIRSNFNVEANGIVSDPLLDSEYKLTSGSPAIGAGVLNAVVTDFDGTARANPPNMGCFAGGAAVAGFLVENSSYVSQSSLFVSPVIYGYQWSPDGMFVYCATNTSFIHKYAATVAYDPETISNTPVGSIDVGQTHFDVWVSDDETALQFMGVDKKIYQWTMSVAGDLTSATDDLSPSIVVVPVFFWGFDWSPDGLSLYVPDRYNDYLIQHTCSVANDPSTITATTNGVDLSAESGESDVIEIVDENTVLLTSRGAISSPVYQYSMIGGDVTAMELVSTYAPAIASSIYGLEVIGSDWYSLSGNRFNKYEVV